MFVWGTVAKMSLLFRAGTTDQRLRNTFQSYKLADPVPAQRVEIAGHPLVASLEVRRTGAG